MRRILTIVAIIIASFIAVSGFFFIIKAAYLAEQGLDLTELPKLEECAHTKAIKIDSNNTISVSGNAIEPIELGQMINGFKQEQPDICLLFAIHELTEVRMLNEISKIADESGLSWNLVIISD